MSEINNLTVSKIYEETRTVVVKAIEKLNKKADKLGVERPTVILGETYTHTYTNGDLNTDNIFAAIEGDYKHYAVDVFDITIKINDLKFNGWKAIAFIDHINKVFIQIDIEGNYDYDFVAAIDNNLCEHCGTNRNRKISWILQNEETNEFKKVGSTCVKDFTGVSPEKFFKMFQFITETIQLFGDEEGMWKRCGKIRNPENYVVYDIDKIWTVAKNIIDVDGSFIKSLWSEKEISGWKSEKFRSNPGKSTADKVNASDIDNIEVNTELVNGMRTWLNDLVVVNEYDEKLKSYSNKFRTRRFDIGFLSYMVDAYIQHLIRMSTPESVHVGVVGEKIVVELTVTSIKNISTQYGNSTLYKMVDSIGNVFTKFGVIGDKFITNGTDGIVVGSTLKFNTEIKNHNEYKGNKETVLGRVSNVPKTKKVK